MQCPQCQYDCSGLPINGGMACCPECGKSFAIGQRRSLRPRDVVINSAVIVFFLPVPGAMVAAIFTPNVILAILGGTIGSLLLWPTIIAPILCSRRGAMNGLFRAALLGWLIATVTWAAIITALIVFMLHAWRE